MAGKYSQLVAEQQQHQGHGPTLSPREQRLHETSDQNSIAMTSEEKALNSIGMEGNVEEHQRGESAEQAETTTTTMMSVKTEAEEEEEDGEDNCSNIMVSSDCDSTLSTATSLSLASNLERFATSDNIFNRQMVARSLLDTLRSVITVEDDVTTVLSVLLKLSDDSEPTVRAELVDLVPQIAAFCLEQTANQKLLDVHPKYLLPLIVKHLSDINNQVRKTSQTALLTLVEQKLLTNDQINDHVYPALLRLSNLENLDHCRAEAVALMSRMASLLGKDLARKLFLDRFVAFCSDSLIQVRKMCAIHFGDMCAVMPEEVTENILLPLFANLCKDGMWGVRKACADVFVTVSCVCLMTTRRNRLAQLFVLLLMDVSRWVRLAAFQALGAFISTFADPNNPFLYYDDEGNIHAACQESTEDEDDLVIEANGDSGFGSRVASNVGSPIREDLDDDMERQCPDDNSDWRLNFDNDGAQLADVTQRLTLSEADDFNCFQYWREPIVDVCLESDLIGESVVVELRPMTKKTNKPNYSTFLNVEMVHDDQDEGFMYHNEMGDVVHVGRRDEIFYGNQRNYATFAVDTLTYNPACNDGPSVCYLSYEEFEAIAPSTLQEIVPTELLYHYIQMTNPLLLQSLDSEIVRYCAFSFPAVALTLGRKHWPLLRNLYKKLASDMQWKVRRTLAFSIHELAAILGRELAALDLVPVFNGFIRDLDEVRIGILRHLSSFISSLPVESRLIYLEKIGEFSEPENERNWRFRLELSQQLARLCSLYSGEDVTFHLLPIAIRLLQDRVAEVRTTTVNSVAVLVDLLACLASYKTKTLGKRTVRVEESRKNSDEFLVHLAVNLVNEFAHHRSWSRRQTFASCCLKMRKSFPRVLMNKHLLPSLLELATDPVANVRLVVAQVLKEMSSDRSSTIINWDQEVKTNLKGTVNEHVSESNDEKQNVVNAALERLQNDPDRDVQASANWTVISPLYSDSVPSAIGGPIAAASTLDDMGVPVSYPPPPSV